MLKTIAIIFGIIMLIVGVLGFLPQATSNGLLLGVFHVNAAHNWIHIATGIASILCGMNSEYAARLFFQIFGVVYGLVAIIGFFYGDRHIFGLIANNMADVILHALIAAFSLYLGFGYPLSSDRDSGHDADRTPPSDR